MNLQDHPAFKQMQQDIALANQETEQQRQADLLEQQRLRQQQAQFLAREYAQAVEDYEQQRLVYHRSVGQVWAAVQAYSKVTGTPPSTFPEAVFTDIHAPTLGPAAYNLSPGFTTTRAAIMAWFNSMGREWK